MNAFDLSDPAEASNLAGRLQADPKVQAATDEMLKVCGITDEFLGHVLLDGLQANKSAVLDGQVIESDVADHGVRRGYLEIALKLKGAYKKTDAPAVVNDDDEDAPAEVHATDSASIEELQNKYRRKPLIEGQASDA